MRLEQNAVRRLETTKDQMLGQMAKEKKVISKKEREAKKLQILEAEVLVRLRDTHLK